MPMIGLPWNSWSGMPWFFIQLRYMKPFLSWVPNHAADRRVGFFLVSDMRSSIVFSTMEEVYCPARSLSNQISRHSDINSGIDRPLLHREAEARLGLVHLARAQAGVRVVRMVWRVRQM